MTKNAITARWIDYAIIDGFTLSFKNGKYELRSHKAEYVSSSLHELIELFRRASDHTTLWTELDDGCAIRRVS